MTGLSEIQVAVKQLSAQEKHEFSKWFLRELAGDTLTEEVVDAIALERFQALDREEEARAGRG